MKRTKASGLILLINHHLTLDTGKYDMALFIRNAPSLVCMVLLFITILSLCEFSSGGGYSYCRIRSMHKIPKRPMFGRQIGKGKRNDHYIEFVIFY